MGAEIFDVEILIDDVKMLYATKCDFQKNKDNNTTVTFQGDVTTGARNTGATISLEGLSFPQTLEEALSLQEKNLEVKDNEKLKENVMEYIDKKRDKYINRKCSFVVYPYHSNTEQIIDTIKNYIKKEDANFIPLIPLNKERTGTSFQPSPLTIEMLRKTIESAKKNAKEVNALLIDDAIIDGKTQEEIKHVLYGLGVSHVMSVFILERRRIPYNTSDNTKTAVFWRLDIPRLGPKYSYPLCKALDTIGLKPETRGELENVFSDAEIQLINDTETLIRSKMEEFNTNKITDEVIDSIKHEVGVICYGMGLNRDTILNTAIKNVRSI